MKLLIAFIMKQINPVHALTAYFFKIHSDTILSSICWSSEVSPSFKFPHQNPVCISPLPFTCHMPRPSDPPLLYHLITFSDMYKL